jgi:hypothetical protein
LFADQAIRLGSSMVAKAVVVSGGGDFVVVTDCFEMTPFSAWGDWASVVGLCVNEGAEGADGFEFGTPLCSMAKLPAFLTLSGGRGRPHNVGLMGSVEEADGGDNFYCICSRAGNYD